MRILLAVHDRPSSSAAVEAARSLFLTRDCEVIVLTVVPPRVTGAAHHHPLIGRMVRQLIADTRASQEHAAWQLVQRTGAHLCDSGARVEMQVRWDRRAGDVIAQVARDGNCDLIVIGAATSRGVARWMGGNVALALSRQATCPVLVAPTATATPARGPSSPATREGAASLAH